MASPEQRRRIERWRDEVATLAIDVDDLRISEPLPGVAQTAPAQYAPTAARRAVSVSATKPAAPVVRVARQTTARTTAPPPVGVSKNDPSVFRVVVEPSSSGGSGRRDWRRSSRSERSYPLATTATSRSRPTAHYATSREDSDRRSKMSLPPTYTQPAQSRRSHSPKHSIIRRVFRLPERENRAKYYVDEYPEPPRPPPRPSRPRPRTADARSDYYARDWDDVRMVRPRRLDCENSPYYYEQPEQLRRDLGRSSTVRGSYGDRRRDDWADRRFQRLHEDVDKMRSVGARRVQPLDTGRARRASHYGDYDYDYRPRP